MDYAIDAVQGMKKHFTSNFIINETLRNSILNMINAETTFAKQMVKSTEEVMIVTRDQFNQFSSNSIKK